MSDEKQEFQADTNTFADEARSATLELTRDQLKLLWDGSLQDGGSPVPMTEDALLLCKNAGNEAVEFKFHCSKQAKLKSSKGFSAEIESAADGWTTIRISNNSAMDEDLFATVALDLLDLDAKFEHETASVRFSLIVDRLKAWRAFMQDRTQALTEAQELGLAGELLFLRSCIERGLPISPLQLFWTGPMRAARDFTFGNQVFVEVKTTRKKLPLRAKIDSLEQLDSADARALFLCSIAMSIFDADAERSSTADQYKTLLQMAEEVASMLPNDNLKEEFKSLMLASGFSTAQLSESNRRFLPEQMRFFRAEMLPSLTPGKIPGIVKAKYEIELLDASGIPGQGVDHAIVDNEDAWQYLRTHSEDEAGS